MFDLYDYEKLLHFVSTCDSQDGSDDVFIQPSHFFHFCYFGKIIFIHKSRKIYQVLASRSCGFKEIASHTGFDVISVNNSLFDAVNSFWNCIEKVINGVNSDFPKQLEMF